MQNSHTWKPWTTIAIVKGGKRKVKATLKKGRRAHKDSAQMGSKKKKKRKGGKKHRLAQ